MNETKATDARWEGKDRTISAGDRLYLLVRKRSKTWIIRRQGKTGTTVRTLGKFPEMSAKQARALAIEDALRRSPSQKTVEALAEEFYVEVALKEYRRPEFIRGYLDRAIVPRLGSRRVAELTPLDIAAVIQGYRARGPRSADQLRSILRAILTYAVEIGIRPDNPVEHLTRRVAGYRPEPRARVLTDDEIRRLWRVEHPNARLLRFLLLTALRISEAQKGERDGDRWRVSAQISKNGKSHWVYLTPSALVQLPLPVCTPTNIQAWLRRWCENQGIEPRFTPHDLRRTAATRMADAGVPVFAVERVLNHTLDGVMAVYNHAEYIDERTEAAVVLERAILGVADV
jgi:integrase